MWKLTLTAAGALIVAAAAVVVDRMYGERVDRRIDEWITAGRVSW